MKKFFLIILGLFIIIILFADVPQLINYQGKIIDDNGQPINDDMNITFKIYDTELNGIVLWNETQNVSITDGVFNVLLGYVEAFSDSLFNENERYLTIQIEGEDEITERSRLVSTPYSINSQQLNGKNDEEVIFPYNVKFMTSTFNRGSSQQYTVVFILTKNGDFYQHCYNSWEQLTSPPVSADSIIFMDATTHFNNGQYAEYQHVYILTKNGDFYRYQFNSWEQMTSPPVSP